MTSRLFHCIEELQGNLPWGAMLDAGTGTHSAGWIATLPTTRWTAVTVAPPHADQVRRAVGAAMRPRDRIVVGNWDDPVLLAGDGYETILADYLIGAVDRFAPYRQRALIGRLAGLARRRIYVVGVEPYVVQCPVDPAGRMVWEIGRLRDACLLLAGETPFREFPASWVIEGLQAAGLSIVAVRRFPIRYRARFVNSQIDMALLRLAALEDRWLAEALRARAELLRNRALKLAGQEHGLRCGQDYVIAAEIS